MHKHNLNKNILILHERVAWVEGCRVFFVSVSKVAKELKNYPKNWRIYPRIEELPRLILSREYKEKYEKNTLRSSSNPSPRRNLKSRSSQKGGELFERITATESEDYFPQQSPRDDLQPSAVWVVF